MLFATTLNVSLRWLRRYPLAAIVLGAFGGPSRVLGRRTARRDGVRGARSRPPRPWPFGWGLLTPLLVRLARRYDGYALMAATDARVGRRERIADESAAERAHRALRFPVPPAGRVARGHRAQSASCRRSTCRWASRRMRRRRCWPRPSPPTPTCGTATRRRSARPSSGARRWAIWSAAIRRRAAGSIPTRRSRRSRAAAKASTSRRRSRPVRRAAAPLAVMQNPFYQTYRVGGDHGRRGAPLPARTADFRSSRSTSPRARRGHAGPARRSSTCARRRIRTGA